MLFIYMKKKKASRAIKNARGVYEGWRGDAACGQGGLRVYGV